MIQEIGFAIDSAPLRRPRQVGNDEADARAKLALVPYKQRFPRRADMRRENSRQPRGSPGAIPHSVATPSTRAYRRAAVSPAASPCASS
jgi:hypothetical protein